MQVKASGLSRSASLNVGSLLVKTYYCTSEEENPEKVSYLPGIIQ